MNVRKTTRLVTRLALLQLRACTQRLMAVKSGAARMNRHSVLTCNADHRRSARQR